MEKEMVIIEAQKRKLSNRSASRKAFRNGQFHGSICPTGEAELSRFFLNKNKVFADKLRTSLPSCLFLTRFCTKGIFARCTWD